MFIEIRKSVPRMYNLHALKQKNTAVRKQKKSLISYKSKNSQEKDIIS